MKKQLCILMALLLAFTLFGCGKAANDGSGPDSSATASEPGVYRISDFTFQAPSSWTHTDIGTDVLQFPSGYLMYEWSGDLVETDADDAFIENTLHTVSLLYEDYVLTEGPVRETIGGCNGFTYAFQYSADGQTMHARAASLFADSGMITFTLVDGSSDASQLPVLDTILASLSRDAD